VGRTGRFSLEGVALNLVSKDEKTEANYIKKIESYFGIQMTPISKLS